MSFNNDLEKKVNVIFSVSIYLDEIVYLYIKFYINNLRYWFAHLF